MTEEIQSAITSDKVETDNTNFATVKADQTCEEALVPRENAFRQLNWQVTLEKGAVYNPPETIGIYAEDIDCKYGVQVDGDVFGRNTVSLEYGGAAHGEAKGDEPLGARVFGSVISEGQVEVTAPDSKLDDWEDAPVSIYGDVIGTHITFDRPTVVYGSVQAEKTIRTNAQTVVIGTVHSDGIVEASDLFAFSVSSHDDLTLGANVAVMSPTIVSETGDLTIADEVGILNPGLFERIRDGNDVDALGLWVFDVDPVWESTLKPVDVTDYGDGQAADRSWRTVNEAGEEHYQRMRTVLEEMIWATRKNPPNIEEFRYSGVTSIGEIDGETYIEGDFVAGSQKKHVENRDVTEVDQSTTNVDQSTEVTDKSTTVEDSVVSRSDIDGGDETSEE